MRSTPESRISLGKYMRREFINNPLGISRVLFHQWTKISSVEQATLTNGYRAWVVLPDLVANWAYLRGDFELEVTDFICMTAAVGMCALDIGAQFGVKSAFLKEAVGGSGRVLAFEPIPTTYSILKRNADNWGVDAYNLALSRMTGTLTMQDYGPGNSGQNTLKRPHYEKVLSGKPVSVNVTTVDQFVQERNIKTHLWKVDTENSEFDVLVGGRQTILDQKPEIIIEVGDVGRTSGEQTKDCLDLLSNLGYQFYEIVKGKLNLIKNNLQSPKTSNILATHKVYKCSS